VALVVSALMSALAFIATFVVVVPLPWTGGYFNLGDAAVILAGLLFGPTIGATAGAIGPTIADIVSGYPVFAPATLVAKGLEGMVTGLIVRRFQTMNKGRVRQFSFVMTALYGLVGVGIIGYLLATNQSPGDWLFPGTWAVIFLAFALLILGNAIRGQWSETTSGVLAGAIGATLMISVYFLYEQLLMGVPAILEVVPNCLQGMLGSGIAGTVYGYKGLRERIESINR